MTENSARVVWPAALVICLVLIAGMWVTALAINNHTDRQASANQDLKVPTAAEIAAEVAKQLPAPTASTSVGNESVPVSSDFTLTKEEFEKQATEDKALELATDSVNSRDFKKAIYNLLVNSSKPVYDLNIESYKDITEVRVKDSEADGDEVDFEVVVYYFTDDDEDNKMKAYLDGFQVTVDHLDFDENFTDAEVDEGYFDLLNVSKVKEA